MASTQPPRALRLRGESGLKGRAYWWGPNYCHAWALDDALMLYNAAMPKRKIGVEVAAEDHFWNDDQSRYVYSYHCPACRELRIIPELGIHRCDCGSWLIVTDQISKPSARV